jgi:AraC family transcriptional regulator of adaptative response / methylphosphotriester-DNA alkyltransferase methyltransferase
VDTLSKRPATAERRRELYLEAAEIIAREYSRDLTVSNVARRIATSRRALQRAFLDAGRTSFRTQLAAVRMQRAARLLVMTDEPVQRIAAAVGYRQPAQFAKAFRRRFGCTPTEFRARRRNGSAKAA